MQHLFPKEEYHKIRVASTTKDLRDAYNLVYNQYRKIKYQAANESKLRFTPHFALPTSHTLIALEDEQVIGTLTMVIDGALGLPIEKEYPEEIRRLRVIPGTRIAEVTCLVTRRPKDVTVLLKLLYAAYSFAIHKQNVTDFCVAVIEDHQKFYAEALLFEQFGPAKEYALINNNRTVAMRLHLPSAQKTYHNIHTMGRMLGRFFLGKTELQQLADSLCNPDKVALCTRLNFARTYLDWSSVPSTVRECIENAYADALCAEDQCDQKYALALLTA